MYAANVFSLLPVPGHVISGLSKSCHAESWLHLGYRSDEYILLIKLIRTIHVAAIGQLLYRVLQNVSSNQTFTQMTKIKSKSFISNKMDQSCLII